LLEASEREVDIFNAVDVFRGHVEAICGGPRTFDLGGKRVTNRPSSDVSYLKAAAYVLWKLDFDQVQLAVDAEELLGLKREQLRKFIHNSTYQNHDKTREPQSTIWAHIPLIEDLVDNYGYRALTDFKVDELHAPPFV